MGYDQCLSKPSPSPFGGEARHFDHEPSHILGHSGWGSPLHRRRAGTDICTSSSGRYPHPWRFSGLRARESILPRVARWLSPARLSRRSEPVIELKAAERQTAFSELAKELVQLKVDVIVAGGVASARPAKAATQTIPIVGVGVGGDPVATGLAQSIAHPGGNFTGFLHGGIDRAKLLQLLQEALPAFTRGGVIWNPDNPVVKSSIDPWDTEARARGLSLRFISATNIEELDAAFASLAAEKIPMAFVPTDPFWLGQAASGRGCTGPPYRCHLGSYRDCQSWRAYGIRA